MQVIRTRTNGTIVDVYPRDRAHATAILVHEDGCTEAVHACTSNGAAEIAARPYHERNCREHLSERVMTQPGVSATAAAMAFAIMISNPFD